MNFKSAYFNIVDTNDVLVIRVSGQPGDDGLGAGDAAGSNASRAHVGGVPADHHSAGGVAGSATRHCH